MIDSKIGRVGLHYPRRACICDNGLGIYDLRGDLIWFIPMNLDGDFINRTTSVSYVTGN